MKKLSEALFSKRNINNSKKESLFLFGKKFTRLVVFAGDGFTFSFREKRLQLKNVKVNILQLEKFYESIINNYKVGIKLDVNSNLVLVYYPKIDAIVLENPYHDEVRIFYFTDNEQKDEFIEFLEQYI